MTMSKVLLIDLPADRFDADFRNDGLKTGLIAFIALSATMPLNGCDSACENEVAQSITSPSGKLRAVTFHRGCGATTAFNTQMSIIRTADNLPNDGGNVLVIDGQVILKIQWLSEDSLCVSGLGAEKVFKQERSASGISIAYR